MVKLEEIKLEDIELFKNLYQFYIYELSRFRSFKLQKNGVFEDNITNFYLSEEDLLSYFIIFNEKVIGFILMQTGNWSPDDDIDYYIGEFFILNMYQNQGLGSKAINELFKAYKGNYLVGQISNNIAAIKFWNSIYEKNNIKPLRLIEKTEEYKFLLQKFKIK